MKLEVRIASETPHVYALEKESIIIGSSKSCDIVIPHLHVSRKHLMLTCQGQQFAIEDLGSTNGTYINNEKLVERTRVEFTVYFPLTIGNEIQISLVSDEHQVDEDKNFELRNSFSDFTSTRVLANHGAPEAGPREEEKAAQPVASAPRRGSRPPRSRRSVESETPRPKLNLVNVFAVVIVGAGFAWQFLWKTPESDSSLDPAPVVSEAPSESATVPRKSRRRARVEATPSTPPTVLSSERIKELRNGPKCQAATDVGLCSVFTPGGGSAGLVVIENYAVAFVDTGVYQERATALLPLPARIKSNIASGREVDDYYRRVFRLTFLIYLKEVTTGKTVELPAAGLILSFFEGASPALQRFVVSISKEAFPALIELLKSFPDADLAQANLELDKQYVLRMGPG